MAATLTNNKSPKRLSKPKQIIAAKVLKEQEGYQASEIAKWLGVSETTAWRYTQADTPKKLQAFETEFSAMVKMMKYDGIGKVYKRVNELIPNERRIDQVVKAGEFLEGRGNNTGNIQVNVLNNISEDKNKYGF